MPYDLIKSLVVLLALLIVGGIFLWRIYRLLWLNLRRGRPSHMKGQWGERVRSVLLYVGAQLRLFRFLIPGAAHFFIFWGFLILSLTIFAAILEGLLAFANPHLVIPILGTFGPLALLQDIFAVLVIVAVVYALYVRRAVDPERYKGSHRNEGVLVLLFIATIMLSLLVINGIRFNLGHDPVAAWRPFSRAVGSLFAGLDESTQVVVEETAYWIHIGVVLVFLTMLPGSKHFHVITSVPAVFLRNTEPRGRLPDAPEFVDDQGAVSTGVSEVEQFTWRQMLDFYTCTECGRCQDVCPMYASGLTLSPKLLMMNLRDNLMERGEVMRRGSSNGTLARELVGDVIPEEAVWACATCYACDQECPLLIEHVTPIVDMRRHLVMEGRVDSELQDVLANLGRYGNSFGKSAKARARWSRPFKPKLTDARKEAVEYLWFVGDYASYSPTLSEITRKTAEVFQHAAMDFGILYDAEQNAGNDVRRVGEEGLFEMLVEKNMAAFERSQFSSIVTTDPHTYNTLKREYPFGQLSEIAGPGSHAVLHYSEVLDQMIASGQLSFSKKLDYTVTYHDPCYLGRYNGVYDAPRRVIEATGCKLVEMPRHGDRAICCGAGGGRIWMEEGDMKERPSESRIHEAAALDSVQALVVTCPKDVTMYSDAVKTTGHEDQVVVKDLIELVYEAL
ncbi:MAG: 4Fe-4S dicluster domain-containing protein [Chloroflexi bacterium]|nr:4Fe-4S dicluster domain-containing protein [Chloroflexota bacterium]